VSHYIAIITIQNINRFKKILAAFGKYLRIIGGFDAHIQDFPYVASIRQRIDNLLICGGSIISQQHILTVAHCFQIGPEDPSEFRIYTGTSFLETDFGTSFRIDTIFIHPLFNGMRTESASLLYDIAIIKVKKIP
jgi:trypsin